MENNEDTVLSMVRARGINLDYLREKLIYIWKQGYSVDMHNTKLVSYDKGITFEPFIDTDMNSFVPTNDGGIVSIDRVLELPSWMGQGTTSKRRPDNIFLQICRNLATLSGVQ